METPFDSNTVQRWRDGGVAAAGVEASRRGGRVCGAHRGIVALIRPGSPLLTPGRHARNTLSQSLRTQVTEKTREGEPMSVTSHRSPVNPNDLANLDSLLTKDEIAVRSSVRELCALSLIHI